jgi:Phosphotransferase enzyme family
VPSTRAETAAKPRRTSATIASCQCNVAGALQVSAAAGYGGAMPVWDAEISIDEALVCALIADQFPDLDASSARLLGEGWDNSVWIVEETWAFRFPRREIAIPGVEREIAALPGLARLLPVAIPVPEFVGRPTERFPWPFFAHRPLPGLEPADTGVSDDERDALGTQLGRFLRVLHAPDTRVAVDPEGTLPVDFNRRADMAVRVPRARENLAYLRELSLWTEHAAVAPILASAERLPPASGELALVHGDLHVRHVLVQGGDIAAVIDLLLVWSLLSPSGRVRFFAEYGPVTDEQLLRSRVLAIVLDSMLVRYAHDAGNASLQRECLAGLERTLVE